MMARSWTERLIVWAVFLGLVAAASGTVAAQVGSFKINPSLRAPVKQQAARAVVTEPVVQDSRQTALVVSTNAEWVEVARMTLGAKPLVKKPVGRGALFEDLEPGPFLVKASADGYEAQTTIVQLEAQKISTISLELEPLKYRVNIRVNVESGEALFARVKSIKGELAEPYTVVPFTGNRVVFDIRAGLYKIELRPEDPTTHYPTSSLVRSPDDIEMNEGNDVYVELKPREARAIRAPADQAKGSVPKLAFGNYHALIIGNNDYQGTIRKLNNAIEDARAVEAVLRLKYGFNTKLLVNAKGHEIIRAINQYKNTLTEDDNLLVFYSGHGERQTDETYWVPVDATDDQDNTTWVSSSVHVLKNFKATRAKHILVISDSCFSGAIDLRELRQPPSVVTTERERYLQKIVASKSRTLMASGGDEPVMDGGGGKHSIFTRALLNGLERMESNVFTASELFRSFIEQQVTGNAKQSPELKSLRDSGHEEGSFIFVRKP